MSTRATLASSPVLRHYRELLELSRRLPAGEAKDAAAAVRAEVRCNAELPEDSLAAQDALRKMIARISFLKMTTSKRVPSWRDSVSYGTYVVRDGDVIQARGQGRGSRVADGKISMEEAWSYHNRLLKRQHFGREPPKTKKIF
mmetsp:Transcript_35135/g.62635  ORF Transcript_35135/g.62635 Transcript_35135/m.62635 type:complete len:143 (-) Transcript_35135:202-630(-)